VRHKIREHPRILQNGHEALAASKNTLRNRAVTCENAARDRIVAIVQKVAEFTLPAFDVILREALLGTGSGIEITLEEVCGQGAPGRPIIGTISFQ
jgi:hypothetical protein